MYFDWSDLAFGSKKPLKELKATFIAAPRAISEARLKQLIKQYLPKGNVVIGISKEQHVAGLDNQPQFKMLEQKTVDPIVQQVAKSSSPYKLYVLTYQQRELEYIFDKISFRHVALVNGSWHHSFHTLPAFYALVRAGIPHSFESAFTDETEAKAYEKELKPQLINFVFENKTYTDIELLNAASVVAKKSYDYGFQTGAVLGAKKGTGYSYLTSSFNTVVPYQAAILLNGASREANLSPPNDLNHYDTVHAEVGIVLAAVEDKIDLEGSTLFINLLPCPPCARMISQTKISEVMYIADHSDGYAVKLLEQSGKKIRRLVP